MHLREGEKSKVFCLRGGPSAPLLETPPAEKKRLVGGAPKKKSFFLAKISRGKVEAVFGWGTEGHI